MPKVKIKKEDETIEKVIIDVWCASCGKGLCSQSKGGYHPNVIYVTPCQDCINRMVREELEKRKNNDISG